MAIMSMLTFRNCSKTPKNLKLQSFALKEIRELSMKVARNSTTGRHIKPRTKIEPESFSIDEAEKLQLRKKLLEGTGDTSKRHVFKQLYPWRTKLQLAEHLKKSEVYNEDGLIALCKPYGIARSNVNENTKDRQTVVQTLDSGGVPTSTPNLEETLPILRDMYKTKELEIVKSTERWTSGILLLSSNKEMSKKVEKCFRRSKGVLPPPLTYWAITYGNPVPDNVGTKVGIGLESVTDVGKVPVIKRKYKNAEVKRGEIKLAAVEHSTLFHNTVNNVSLVEVNIQTVRWHFLRVWLANCYSPVLGDALYSSRVKQLFGRKIKVSPQNLSAHQPPEISNDIYKQLELPNNKSDMIPSLIHMAKIELVQFNKDKSNLTLTTPPPSHFSWACQKLELMLPNELDLILEERDRL